MIMHHAKARGSKGGERERSAERREGEGIPVFDNIVVKLPNSLLCDLLEHVRKNQVQQDSTHGDSKDDKRRRYRVLSRNAMVNRCSQ